MDTQKLIETLSEVLKPEVFIEVGSALRLAERITMPAIEMFQAGRPFEGAATLGDSLTGAGFEAMADFCNQNPALFKAFIKERNKCKPN